MEAAEILAELAANHRFTLYEYFITDRAGHMQDSHLARDVLSNLATFVRTLIDKVDLSSTTIVLTSDHGNVEDLSSKNHTRNEVPTLIWGAAQISIAARLRNLADITPAIIYASSEMGGGCTHHHLSLFVDDRVTCVDSLRRC
ncbi:MAG: alkaline phosphatase family protein [Pyrinomonadaceae bacterium]